MRIIHCSDIHLDSAMDTNLSAEKARERNSEIRRTFKRMVEYAKDNAVGAILIAGDLFDTDRVTAYTAEIVLDTIAQAPNIDFLYLKGNHDESINAFSAKPLPQNLKCFSDKLTCYRYDNVTISGIELNDDNKDAFYSELKLSDKDINIVVMHGQVSSSLKEGEVCLPLLKNRNIRYLALGHLHGYRKEKLDLEGEYCYCGCLEGRGFDECGEKGFVLLNIRENRVETEFVPFAERVFHEVNVDISGIVSVNDIITAARNASKGIDRKDIVKYVLCGNCTPQTQKNIPYMLNELKDEFYFVKIKDESRLKPDAADYSMDISLKGEFIRTVMAAELSEEEKSQIILCGLQALSGEEISL